VDVLPTFVAAAGGKADPAWGLDGVDLLPFLTGADGGRPHETLFWRIDGRWAVRHGDYKLVLGTPNEKEPGLFDLAKDPGETRNLAAELPEKAKELDALYDAWDGRQAEPADPKDKKKKKRREAAR
jgi:arylsulfatase A-like enzyme